ncbi:MAG: hypothetical protein DI556_08750 [Rhodovulum sulfidophilum]|uniref:CAAX prenyl protease 2/Lysostaphin resistance protein A-like domain-containing protein n=1 Tax=Rhodovulum sulfidophilum TaxID=35806 RepID=A0A2W5N9I9_RHOSU|nr:MAG: hypothetical protein DI556_08750 [Rhodovulum sulfidophilum]
MPFLSARDARFETFVDPARPRRELWRLLLAAPILLLGYAAGSFFAGLVIGFGKGFVAGYSGTPFELTPRDIALIHFYSFAGCALALFGLVRSLHRRAVGTIFGRGGRLDRRAFVGGLAAGLIVFTIFVACLLAFGRPVQRMSLPAWSVWLLFATPAIFVQSLTEEMVFRGYLQQQLAARFRSPFFWAVLPSVVFGLLHFRGSLENSLLAIPHAALLGLIAADITARTGNIGTAAGLHFGINFGAFLVFANFPDPAVFALWHSAPAAFPFGVSIFTVLVLAAYGVWRAASRRSGAADIDRTSAADGRDLAG